VTQNQQLLDLLRDVGFRLVIPCDLVKLVREYRKKRGSKADYKQRSTRNFFGRDCLVDLFLWNVGHTIWAQILLKDAGHL
jgi:hypothetical protein